MATQPQPFIENQPLVIRRAVPADAEVCGRICFEAFTTLAEKHRFPPDFPAPEVPIHVLSMMFSHPAFFCVVAERDGAIIGSTCLDERTSIAGVGPITIDFTPTMLRNKSAKRGCSLPGSKRMTNRDCTEKLPQWALWPDLVTHHFRGTYAGVIGDSQGDDILPRATIGV
jgi:hypothetical protein